MEKSAQSRERDGPNENVARPKPKPLKEEHQKKKKLVFFELDNWNDDQCREFDVPSFKIEELYSAGSKECNGGRSGVADDGLSRESSDGRDSVTSPETCPLDKVPCGDAKRMIFDEFGIDLIELQNRILELEKQLKHDNLELPAILSDLKSQVENFRNKLETTEWRRKTELQKELFCQRFQYRRTSSERGRKIREKFLNICEKEINESTIAWLKQPSFDSGQYEDEEILLFIQHMFQELGFIEKFQIRLPVLRNFLYEVYKNYNEVPFHNFRHCFCVAQMMYVMIWSVDILTKMGDLDTLILLTACICHDLDHPGYNNIYQINARTDLALLYNDISPLENHHCSVAFRILENPDCNIFAAVDKETFREIREGIIRCILATDMARHNEILTQFKEIISDFDFTNKGHKNLLSMILIKVADISNEARPMNVAEPWLDRLLTEFFKQSDAEKEEGLPVTPFMDRDKITKPSSQCSFIGFVLLPLFEALGKLLPELHDLIITPAKEALEHYKRLNEAAKDERMRRKSIADASNAENGDEIDHGGMVKSGSGHSVRSRRSFCYSCPQVRQKSKSSDDLEPDSPPPRSPSAFSVVVDDFENLDERDEYDENDSDEEMDEETVTEVEVSEKTLKFKISTEGGMNLPSGRKSCPDTFSGSRKGSRERNQYLENDSEWSRMMRNRALKRSITSDTMSSGKGSSDDLENHKSGERNIRKKSESLEGRGDDLRWFPSSRYNDVSGRRKSLAVERPRTTRLECTVRRGSLASATKSSVASFAVATPTSKPNTIERDSVDSILEKFSDRSQELEEGRNSKEFETSCWGLQNLKIGAGPLTVIVPNVACDAIERKSIKSEKSKSEDNLSITTMASGKKKSESYVVLTNNANLAGKKEKGDEKAGQERKQNYTSILSRLKHLREKIAFGRETETTSEPATPETSGNSVASSAGLVKIKEKSSSKEKWNRRIETECYGEDFERSRTLPKTRKPSRTSGAKMRRGWRALIGKSEANSSSSSLDFPSPNSPSPLQRRKTSSEEGTTPTAATPPTTTQKTSTAVSLSDKKKSSTWLPSPKKSGFLGRIGGRCEFDVEGGRNNFLNSLTSSFRKKGTKNEDENGAGVSGSGENMATKKLN